MRVTLIALLSLCACPSSGEAHLYGTGGASSADGSTGPAPGWNTTSGPSAASAGTGATTGGGPASGSSTGHPRVTTSGGEASSTGGRGTSTGRGKGSSSAASDSTSASSTGSRTGSGGTATSSGTSGAGSTSGGASGSGTSGACSPAFGAYTNSVPPPPCFEANGPQSPLTVRLPASPKYDPNDATYVQNLMTISTQFGLQPRTPFFFSSSTDPLYTVHCTEPWGTCNMEGKQVHIPNGAVTEGVGDGHLTVLDQVTNQQFDMWATDGSKLNPKGGPINCAWGGMDAIGGLGTGCQAIAANFCQYGLTVHINELDQGVINHPLQLDIPCEDANPVYPSTGQETNCKNGIDIFGGEKVAEPQPHLGMLFALDYTDAQIAAMNLPTWQSAVITALAHYGAFITDTGTAGWSTGLLLMHEDPKMYSNFGIDPWGEFFKANGLSDSWNATAGVNVKDHLHLIDPCVLKNNCP